MSSSPSTASACSRRSRRPWPIEPRALRGAWAAALLLAGVCAPARTAFYAAAGKADISPDLKRETVWLAGYGAKGRRALGVRDPLYARAAVISDGRRTVALVAVDSIGLFREDVLAMRRELGWTGEKEYLFVAATHDHSAPDTMGLWGRLPGLSGVDRRYRRRLRRTVAELVRGLSGRLEQAQLRAARLELDPAGLCRDFRDPAVLDPELDALELRGRGGKRLAALVRWSCHPEALGKENRWATADYPGRVCARLEEAGGGTCVFFSGSIGGLLGPDTDRAGGVERQFEEAERVGRRLADAAAVALRSAAPVSGPVSFESRVVRLPLENSRYILFLPTLASGHALLDAQGRRLPYWERWWLPLRHLALFPLPERLRPWIESEVSLVRLGPVRVLGVPGELFPELAIGGYDGSRRYSWPLISPNNPAPPDLAAAPKGPYLRRRLPRHGLIVGLANDEIGYIVPPYDFRVAATRSMTPKPPGHHYEETNSVGPSAAGIVLRACEELLAR